MSEVIRLPKQHRQKPHCATCGRALPDLKSVQITAMADEFGDTSLYALTFHVRCACGAPWDLRKEIA
ncbi:MAG TPA: hypothetical protein VEG84_03090 [Thermoanaerobaculia bacterium]|nr:hypothetical protein [Thermoanaerobaculia bacterium]